MSKDLPTLEKHYYKGKHLPSVPIKTFEKQLCLCKCTQNLFSMGEGWAVLFPCHWAFSWVHKSALLSFEFHVFSQRVTKLKSWNHSSLCLLTRAGASKFVSQPHAPATIPSTNFLHQSFPSLSAQPTLLKEHEMRKLPILAHLQFHPCTSGWQILNTHVPKPISPTLGVGLGKLFLSLFPTYNPGVYPSKTKSYLDVKDHSGWSLKKQKALVLKQTDISPWILQMADLEVLVQGASFVVIIKISSSYWALVMWQALC